jgi:hypothetical protein
VLPTVDKIPLFIIAFLVTVDLTADRNR